MSALVLLIACLLLGVCVARWGRPPSALSQSLNWWVLNIALPALVLRLMADMHFDSRLWFPPVAMWAVFLGAWGFFALVGRRRKWSDGRIGALVLTCGLGNTSFIGLPMIEALRGGAALKVAIIADQVGCFLALAIGGGIVSSVYGGGEIRPAAVVRRVVLFPPFIALLLGSLAGTLGPWPELIAQPLARIGETLFPLALFSIGLRLQFRPSRSQLGALVLGLGWKLLLAPLLILVCGRLLGLHEPVLSVTVLEAGMAPMISAALLAEQYDLEPRLTNTVLGLGTALSMLSVPLLNSWL